jgi:hypothetical protein
MGCIVQGDWNTTVMDSRCHLLVLQDRISAKSEKILFTGGDPARIPDWAYTRQFPNSKGATEPRTVVDVGIGWPWPAFRYRSFDLVDGTQRFEGAWQMGSVGSPSIRPQVVPLIPVLPGLFADVALLGAAPVLPFALARFGKVWRFDRRLRSGQCVRCRYDLRTGGLITCPECGTPAPGAVAG